MSPAQESGAATSAYKPYANVRRPGAGPGAQPPYRVLVHRKHESRWLMICDHIPLDQAQRLYDHVSQKPLLRNHGDFSTSLSFVSATYWIAS